MSAKFTSKLKGMKKGWKNTRKTIGKDKGGFSKASEGDFIVNNLTLELKNNSNGALMINRNCTICEGEEKGTKIFDSVQLEAGERSLEFAMKFFNAVGYEDLEIEEIEEICIEISSQKSKSYNITHKVNEAGFSNVYFDSIIESDGSSDDSDNDSDNDSDIDLDNMDMDQMIEYCEKNNLMEKLSLTKRKLKKMDEDSLADMIENYLEKKDDSDSDDKKTMKGADKKETSDNPKLLSSIKNLLLSYAVDGVKPLKTLKEIKVLLTEEEIKFPKKELEKDEINDMKEAGLTSFIK